jgi:Ca2+/H+ antiporter
MAAHPLASHLWLPLGVTLGEVVVALLVLHGAVGHAMRARGMAWRLADSALVSPLLLVGLALFFGAINHGMLRYALDVARGHASGTHLAAMLVVSLGGLVVAWFGGRAVGKLY